MSPRRLRASPAPPDGSRYTYDDAVKEIERYLDRRGRGSAKALALHLGLTDPQLSHRMRGWYAKFSLEHFGAIADWATDPDTGEPANPGWPFVTRATWETSLRAAVTVLAGNKRKT